jgi:hypothetical protein
LTFFVGEGDRFRATEHTRGPWSEEHQHGGPSAALLARAIERHVGVDAIRVARMSVVFHRPLLIDLFRITTETTREGKKVRTVRAQLFDAQDRLVATADATLIRTAPIDVETTPATNDRLPEACPPYTFTFFNHLVGYHTAMECRLLHGRFGEGKMGLWMRMRFPLLDGETPSPLQRTMIAADSGNGVSVTLDLAKYTFVNPDVTVALSRQADGEWIGLDARTSFGPDGIGLADTRLLDAAGTIGRGIQTLIVECKREQPSESSFR